MDAPPQRSPGTSVPESRLHHFAWLDLPSHHLSSLTQLGGQNKIPQTGVGGGGVGLKQQRLISHSSGGLMSGVEVAVDLVSDESPLPGL